MGPANRMLLCICNSQIRDSYISTDLRNSYMPGSRYAQGTRQEVTITTRELNSSFCSLLKNTIGEDRFQLWFSAPGSFSFDNFELSVTCSSSFKLDRIRSQFSHSITEAATTLGIKSIKYKCSSSGDDSDLEKLLVPGQPEKDDNSISDSNEKTQPDVRQNRSVRVTQAKLFDNSVESRDDSTSIARNNTANRQHKLEHFVFDQNELVRTGVDMVLRSPGQLTPFTIFGNCGTGKTHLLRGLYDEVRRARVVSRVLFLTAEQFTSQFVGSINGKGLALFRQKCRDVDMLFIDDVHHFAGKTATVNEFQYTIDTLLRRGRQIVIGSAVSPSELEFLGAALANRLASGLTCQLQTPGKDGRFQILSQWCRDRSIDISRDTLQFIADHVNDDVRKLSGCLNLVHATQIVERTQLTVEQAKTVLKDQLPGCHLVSLSEIEKIVCETCGVDSGALKSRRKQQVISSARMLAIWLSRKHTSAALTEIGNYYGGRSHSTVLSAKKTVEGWLKEDRAVPLPKGQKTVHTIIKRIESELRVG